MALEDGGGEATGGRNEDGTFPLGERTGVLATLRVTALDAETERVRFGTVEEEVLGGVATLAWRIRWVRNCFGEELSSLSSTMESTWRGEGPWGV